jgi:hypothetical protein
MSTPCSRSWTRSVRRTSGAGRISASPDCSAHRRGAGWRGNRRHQRRSESGGRYRWQVPRSGPRCGRSGRSPAPGCPPASTASLAPQGGGRITGAAGAGHRGPKKSREPRSGGHRATPLNTPAKSGRFEKVGSVNAKGHTEVERLGALVDRKLGAMERQEKPPSVAELNAVRRLVDWLNRERAIEQSRTLTTR